MIYSMTGFGKVSCTTKYQRINIEIRSINSKQADISMRLPADLREIEMDIRRLVNETLVRGKVDLFVGLEPLSTHPDNRIDTSLALGYWNELKELHRETGIPMPTDPMRMILSMPGIYSNSMSEEKATTLKSTTIEGIKQALSELIRFRTQEGQALEDGFRKNIARITELLGTVEEYEGERIEVVKKRLNELLQKYTDGNFDNNRYEQELIYYIDKFDVNEEKCRLANHLQYFLHTLEQGQEQGRKLGFIAQEMGREINTLGSKSNHAEMQKIVVMMKEQLEQIKEQILNVL